METSNSRSMFKICSVKNKNQLFQWVKIITGTPGETILPFFRKIKSKHLKSNTPTREPVNQRNYREFLERRICARNASGRTKKNQKKRFMFNVCSIPCAKCAKDLVLTNEEIITLLKAKIRFYERQLQGEKDGQR